MASTAILDPTCPDEYVDTLTSHCLELLLPLDEGGGNQGGRGRRRERRVVRMEKLRRWMRPILKRPDYPRGSVLGFDPPASTKKVWTRVDAPPAVAHAAGLAHCIGR